MLWPGGKLYTTQLPVAWLWKTSVQSCRSIVSRDRSQRSWRGGSYRSQSVSGFELSRTSSESGDLQWPSKFCLRVLHQDNSNYYPQEKGFVYLSCYWSIINVHYLSALLSAEHSTPSSLQSIFSDVSSTPSLTSKISRRVNIYTKLDLKSWEECQQLNYAQTLSN